MALAIDDYDDERQAADRETELLFHYTDAAGLIGIVDHPGFPTGYKQIKRLDFSRVVKFRASDVRYMNDSTELRYAGLVFADQFRKALAGQEVHCPRRREQVPIDSSVAADLSQLAGELEREEFYAEPVQVFAVCVSHQGDLLSQWRGYAGGTGGYAIGFSRNVLQHHVAVLPPFLDAGDPQVQAFLDLGFLPALAGLHDVVYSADQIRAIADGVIADHTRTPTREATEHLQSSAAELRWKIVPQLARFKNPSFIEEEEVRLLTYAAGMPHTGLPLTHAEFRTGGRTGIVPYWCLAVNLERGIGPQISGPRPARTIERLVIGPGHDQHLRASAARQLLVSNGHDPEVVALSQVPFVG